MGGDSERQPDAGVRDRGSTVVLSVGVPDGVGPGDLWALDACGVTEELTVIFVSAGPLPAVNGFTGLSWGRELTACTPADGADSASSSSNASSLWLSAPRSCPGAVWGSSPVSSPGLAGPPSKATPSSPASNSVPLSAPGFAVCAGAVARGDEAGSGEIRSADTVPAPRPRRPKEVTPAANVAVIRRHAFAR